VPSAHESPTPPARKRTLIIAGASALLLIVVLATFALLRDEPATRPEQAAPAPQETAVPAPPPGPGLQTVAYEKFQTGWGADPNPTSTTGITVGVHPLKPVPMYDKVGGKARAWMAPTIAPNVDVVLPVIDRRLGWVAVLVPSANRSVAWIPNKDLMEMPLRDHIVVYRKAHKMVWLKDDKPQKEWRVTLGSSQSPTPLGRSFVLGRSRLPGYVYASTDIWALSSIPDDPNSVPTGLRGAHTGIHTWYNDDTIGMDVSDGCIRLTKSGQQLLLRELESGTPVTVLP
jgi:hypothetical protein